MAKKLIDSKHLPSKEYVDFVLDINELALKTSNGSNRKRLCKVNISPSLFITLELQPGAVVETFSGPVEIGIKEETDQSLYQTFMDYAPADPDWD